MSNVARESRGYVAKLDALGIVVDDDLCRVLARADVDDAFHADLESLMFELAPMHAAELDCLVPSFIVIAMNGGGDAYGLYLEPSVLETVGRPWVYWDHETDSMHFIATDTSELFSQVLDAAASWHKDDARLQRVRTTLLGLGLALHPPSNLGIDFGNSGRPASWLKQPEARSLAAAPAPRKKPWWKFWN